MSSKYIDNGSYAATGYSLGGLYQTITVGRQGTIGGSGLIGGGSQAYDIVNRGSIVGAATAILLEGGGTVANSGTISASAGVGVSLAASGLVSNSASGLVEGYGGTALESGVVVNAGTIAASGAKQAGIYFLGYGLVRNGASGEIDARGLGIAFADGVGTVVNTGTISGSARYGILLRAGGTVANGVGAMIEGATGLDTQGAPGTVVNDGTIFSAHGAAAILGAGGLAANLAQGVIEGSVAGIRLYDGGTVTNSRYGLIEGGVYGIQLLSGAATIDNGGTILSGLAGVGAYDLVPDLAVVNFSGGLIHGVQYGIRGRDGGTVSNAAGAMIEGSIGIDIENDPGTITNAGLIKSVNDGIRLGAGGLVINRAGGVIDGRYGIFLSNPNADGTIVNAGTITGAQGPGIYLSGSGTVTNFGTIASGAGATGTAITFAKAADILVDEAGSVLIGTVAGAGETLELAGVSGTLSGLGTAFTGFASVDVLAGASWVLTGTDALASETASLTSNGLLTVTGTATVAVTVAGTGTLQLAGGSTTLATGAVLTVARFAQSGGSLRLAKNLTYNGSFVQTAGPIYVAGQTLVLNGPAALSNGAAVNGTGFLASDGSVDLGSYTVNGGATWQVYGSVNVSNYLTLGNGGGGSGRLAIERGGVFDITVAGGAVIAPGGSGTIVNDALLEKTGGTGVSLIAPALTNAGTLKVTSGTLDLAGVVGGSGSATIGSGGALRFDTTVTATQAIGFAGTAGGRLVLNDPSGSGLGFAGTVTGFGGRDEIDLATFAFSGHPSVGWSQTSASGGTLTVTDGSKVAKITLFGQYAQSGFGKSQDAGIGTVLTYTPPAQMALAIPHR